MLRRLSFGVVLIFILAGCEHTPTEVLSHCQRWAAKFVNVGAHENRNVYRQDLISTCMALKHTPYDYQQQPQSPSSLATSAWINASVQKEEYTKTLGRDKANCIERGYVGQAIQGQHSGEISGFGLGSTLTVGGTESERYSSTPVFNEELFEACMNGAGWELAVSRPLNPDPIPHVGADSDLPAIAPVD